MPEDTKRGNLHSLGGSPDSAMAALQGAATAREQSFHGYIQAVAHGRFVLRRVMQILDEQPREQGLEPLQHQVLLQVFGADEEMTVGKVADRLGIVAAFGSRLVSQLQRLGLIERRRHSHDRRVSIISASESGVELLRSIDREIYRKVQLFQEELDDEGKYSALLVFAAYVGIDGDAILTDRIRDSARWATKLR